MDHSRATRGHSRLVPATLSFKPKKIDRVMTTNEKFSVLFFNFQNSKLESTIDPMASKTEVVVKL